MMKGICMVNRVRIAVYLVAVSTSACGTDLPPPIATVEQAGERAEVIGQDCPAWGCGTNAASVDGRLSFHELSTCGDANAAGVKLLGVKGPHQEDLRLEVVGDRLVGQIAGSPASRLTGSQLVGATLNLELPGAGATRTILAVRLAAVGSTGYWVASELQVPTYRFEVQVPAEAGGGVRALCAGTPDSLSSDWLEQVGSDARLALIFAGDRYDAVRKTVSIDPAPSCWFNIGCAGSAAAKMHLLRHTTAGSNQEHITTQPQRQAMLKMLTDDICGIGQSFTVGGERVYYEDMRLWHPFPARPASIEAMWGSQGALCLDEPRRQHEDPAVTERIQKLCAAVGHDLPRCPITVSNYETWPALAASGAFGYGLSANPP
jgi:hypothetical protein